MIFRGNEQSTLACRNLLRLLNSFIAPASVGSRKVASETNLGSHLLSGIDAVKKIVQTEAQARRIVEEANARAQEILSRASQETEKIRQDVLSSARTQREEILAAARAEAEAEAAKADVNTTQQLESFQKAFETRKEHAVAKAVELILGG